MAKACCDLAMRFQTLLYRGGGELVCTFACACMSFPPFVLYLVLCNGYMFGVCMGYGYGCMDWNVYLRSASPGRIV